MPIPPLTSLQPYEKCLGPAFFFVWLVNFCLSLWLWLREREVGVQLYIYE